MTENKQVDVSLRNAGERDAVLPVSSSKTLIFREVQIKRALTYHQNWDWNDLNSYYTWKYGRPVRPVKRRSECSIPEDCTCSITPFSRRPAESTGHFSSRRFGKVCWMSPECSSSAASSVRSESFWEHQSQRQSPLFWLLCFTYGSCTVFRECPILKPIKDHLYKKIEEPEEDEIMDILL